MNFLTIATILSLAAAAAAEFPVNVTVSLAAGHSTTGKMRIDLLAGPSYLKGVFMQQHMQALNGGESYSAVINMPFPLSRLREVSLMWFKKKLSFGSNTLLFRHVTLEPMYARSLEDMKAQTEVVCGRAALGAGGRIIPTPGQPEYPVIFDVPCHEPDYPHRWGKPEEQ